jgi:predicted metal-binding protein
MENIYETLMKKAKELGAIEAKVMEADQIVFDSRSYLKCRFGCNRWGKYWTCPPNLSLSPETFINSISSYSKAIVIKASDPTTGQKVALAVEKEAMLSHGCRFAFALTMCVLCEECAYPDPCRFPHLARPTGECVGIDIVRTLEPLEFSVDFDREGHLIPAWYSIVLLD